MISTHLTYSEFLVFILVFLTLTMDFLDLNYELLVYELFIVYYEKKRKKISKELTEGYTHLIKWVIQVYFLTKILILT